MFTNSKKILAYHIDQQEALIMKLEQSIQNMTHTIESMREHIFAIDRSIRDLEYKLDKLEHKHNEENENLVKK